MHVPIYAAFSPVKKIKRLLVLLPLLIQLLAHAQGKEIRFTIVNQKREPVKFASFTIINRADSLQVWEKVADSSGMTTFKLPAGQYLVKISSVNYQPVEKGVTVGANSTSFVFTADALPKTLGGVVVTTQKPLMRQEDDKTIVDAENLAASSTSGYEVIEKTPGLFVDQDGNIYINSFSPAQVYINGREMKMSAADVATLLKSLPPNAIAQIEILRTPSAKYDATSTGGIVNVVLRKGVKIGMTGSVNGGMQQGNYGNQFVGFSLNNSDGKKNSFINLNYSRRNSYERIMTDRIFAPDSMLGQEAFTKYPGANYFVNYGYANSPGKNWEVDFSSSASLNEFDNRTQNLSVIKKISTAETISGNINNVNNEGRFFNLRLGVSGKLKIDSTGSEWVNDVFYNYTSNNSDQVFTSNYSTPVVFISAGGGNSNNKRNLVVARSDLKLKMKHQFTFESGAKASALGFRNIAEYFKESGGVRSKDNARTNTFRYTENINSAYLQGSKTITDVVIKSGVRLENTNMEGHQVIPSDTSFTIHRTDLFPYVYISKPVMKIAGYELRAYLVYRRTITRPVYDQLNPFPRYIDQYLSEVGNPGLRPQFTTNYEANVSVDERPILAIGMNKTRDIFTNVIYQSDTSQSQAYRTVDNLGNNKEWYLRGLGAIPPGKKYFFVVVAQYNHNLYEGLYENKPLSFKKGTWTFFTYHSLKLGTRSLVTMHGFLRLKGQQQFYELSSFGALNASINRQFLKQKLTVTLNMNDIFGTNKNDFTIKQGSVNASGSRQGDSRRIGINVRYNFGIRKKEENNQDYNIEPAERN